MRGVSSRDRGGGERSADANQELTVDITQRLMMEREQHLIFLEYASSLWALGLLQHGCIFAFPSFNSALRKQAKSKAKRLSTSYFSYAVGSED